MPSEGANRVSVIDKGIQEIFKYAPFYSGAHSIEARYHG